MEMNVLSKRVFRQHKVVLLGDCDVGKSTLVIRLVNDESLDPAPTTTWGFFRHKFILHGTPLELLIWDTAGQERFQSLGHMYYRGSSAALLVYDITRKETFSRVQMQLQELEKYFQKGALIICLIGNKSDLHLERQVTEEDGKAFADSKGLLFIETSARTGDNVKQAFETVAWELIAEYNRKKNDMNFTLREERPCVLNACCNY